MPVIVNQIPSILAINRQLAALGVSYHGCLNRKKAESQKLPRPCHWGGATSSPFFSINEGILLYCLRFRLNGSLLSFFFLTV